MVSPTVLAQKAHGSEGLPLEELLHRVNDQCIAHGLPTRDDLPPQPPGDHNAKAKKSTPKWRIC